MSRFPRLLILIAAAGALLGLCASAQAATATFGYTGGEQVFVVPGGVSTIHVRAVGGSGGEGDALGGEAAIVNGNLAVTAGQTLYVEVGGRGLDKTGGGTGGFNGGADGGSASGGGGGASDLRLLARTSGLSPDTRLIVAAGGGGGAGVGVDLAGKGGNAGEGGENGGWVGGGAGTQTEGGAGGEGCLSFGESGQLGFGGVGGFGESGDNGGGGGGGGLYGGGGGGGGCSSGGGGGGGGSSFGPAGAVFQLASLVAPPEVEITYTPPAPAPTPAPPPVAHCVVPKLSGKKLKGAKKALRNKNCSLGTVTKKEGATAKTGRVKRQSPKAGKVLAAGAKVNVTLKP